MLREEETSRVGRGYFDIIPRDHGQDFYPTWGPTKFSQADHPLQIMVLYNSG